MSGGEQQRIAIARALINTPPLLLADEPTGNLDSANAAGILDLLARLRAEHDMTIILASHDPQIAARCRTADPAPRRRSRRRHPAHQGPPGTGHHPARRPAGLTNALI